MFINSTTREPYPSLYNMIKVLERIIIKFSILQMLHGCRSDLTVKCLVNSIKDRNFSLFLLSNILNLSYYINNNINTITEI